MPRKTIKRKRYRRKTRGGERTVDDAELRILLTSMADHVNEFQDRVADASMGDMTNANGATVDDGKIEDLIDELVDYLKANRRIISGVRQKLALVSPLNYTRLEINNVKAGLLSNLIEMRSISQELPSAITLITEIETEIAFIEDKFIQILQLY